MSDSLFSGFYDLICQSYPGAIIKRSKDGGIVVIHDGHRFVLYEKDIENIGYLKTVRAEIEQSLTLRGFTFKNGSFENYRYIVTIFPHFIKVSCKINECEIVLDIENVVDTVCS